VTIHIHGTTRVAAVIGWPVEHSRSPEMLNAAFSETGIDAVLVPIGVPPESLAVAIAGLRAQRFLGASITAPHKLAAAELCDELTPAAKAIGAANCLALAGDKLVGHNTDADGFADALAAAGFDHRDKRVVIVGAGGAARAVEYGLRGAAAIDVVARRHAEIAWTRARPISGIAADFANADLVVDCTPTGLDDRQDAAFAASLPLDRLPQAAWVATLVYHRRPALLSQAAARGHQVVDGRAMLVHQGARAFTIWTGVAAPIDRMSDALARSL